MKVNFGKLKTVALVCLVLMSNFHKINGDDDGEKIKNPRIVIVGAGVSGIAAASKLFENGFTNLILLEAENRIGGRIYTAKFGDDLVDLGGEWVHGAVGNVVYELASPYNLVERIEPPFISRQTIFVDSNGNFVNDKRNKIIESFMAKYVIDSGYCKNSTYESIGECITKKFEYKLFNDELSMNEARKYLNSFELFKTSVDSAESWFDIASNSPFIDLEGDRGINWKKRGYSTILDILMKRFPNPEEELPILNRTFLSTEVTSIDYSGESSAVIKTSSGQIFKADHVIVTVSLGVLKAKHQTLFFPKLPIEKIKAVEEFGFGNVAKIYLLFDKRFYPIDSRKATWVTLLWEETDKKLLESDPERSWMLGIQYLRQVKHKPNVLSLWIAKEYARQMEAISEEKIYYQSIEVLQRFLGKKYNVTEPVAMLRSQWFTNPHFRGTYSYRSVSAQRDNLDVRTLEEPLVPQNMTILFAGEATSLHRYGCVDGAIASGWRAADKLVNFYEKL